MKRFWIVILLLAIFLMAWFWHSTHHIRPVGTQQATQTANPPIGTTNIANLNVPNTTTSPFSPSVSKPPPSDIRSPAGFLRYVEDQNKPIVFYGQIIDQNGNPVTGAKVDVGIRHWTMPDPLILQAGSKEIHLDQTSDADGRFEFHGATGDGFGIGITKDGYQLSAKAPRDFAPQTGSYANPVIIKMWKLGEPQKLISHSLSRIGIPVDGQPVQFDLFNGAKVPSGGQLIVRFERNPQSLPPGDSGYDWSATLEIPNGGLAVNNDEFMYQAPESGYQEIYKVEMPKGATNWTPTLDRQFYIQLENGKCFGSLSVHLPTFHNTPPVGLNLGITINPSGSRNLQP